MTSLKGLLFDNSVPLVCLDAMQTTSSDRKRDISTATEIFGDIRFFSFLPVIGHRLIFRIMSTWVKFSDLSRTILCSIRFVTKTNRWAVWIRYVWASHHREVHDYICSASWENSHESVYRERIRGNFQIWNFLRWPSRRLAPLLGHKQSWHL